MALLNQTPKRVTGGILAVVLCVVSLGLITLWSYEGGAQPEASGVLHSTRTAVSTIISPFNRASSLIGQATDAVGTAASDATASPERLSQLQALNEELASEVMKLEEYRLENERLAKLLELYNAYDLEATGAHILRTSVDSWNQTITIDKGSVDGLAVGMPVMSPNGLIGQVESVGRVTSEVRLLTDPNSGVAVIVQGSRSEGVLTGSHTKLLYLGYISVDAEIKPGDAVITSGAGGIYPKGIIIGEVTSVQYTPSDVFQTIVVKPTARVKYYEEVLVLTGRPSELTYNVLAASGQTPQSSTGTTGASGTSDTTGTQDAEDEQNPQDIQNPQDTQTPSASSSGNAAVANAGIRPGGGGH